jgi:hypothetical protein
MRWRRCHALVGDLGHVGLWAGPSAQTSGAQLIKYQRLEQRRGTMNKSLNPSL